MKKHNSLNFELLVSKLLRNGVYMVGVILTLGWILNLDFKGNIFLQYQNYSETSLSHTITDAWGNKQWGLLLSYIGLSVLISLPLIRVVMTCILFAKEKEYIMMGISILVLSGLCLSFLLGAVK